LKVLQRIPPEVVKYLMNSFFHQRYLEIYKHTGGSGSTVFNSSMIEEQVMRSKELKRTKIPVS